MFDVSRVGTVNANHIGGHEPETLLVVAPDGVRARSRGWNLFEAPDGSWQRVADAAGRPPYPPAEVTAADLAGVTVDGEEEVVPVVVEAE